MRAVVLATFLALAGCGALRTESADGTVETRFFLGLADLPACGEDGVAAVSLTSLGAWAGREGGGLGYRRARQACLPAGCHVVVFAEGADSAAAWRPVLAGMEGICITR